MTAPRRPLRGVRISERDLQDWVEDAMRKLNWLYFHPWSSLHSPAGFPDLCAIRGPRLLFCELKTDAGDLSFHQQQWADALTACPGVEYYLIRPADWLNGKVDEILR